MCNRQRFVGSNVAIETLGSVQIMIDRDFKIPLLQGVSMTSFLPGRAICVEKDAQGPQGPHFGPFRSGFWP